MRRVLGIPRLLMRDSPSAIALGNVVASGLALVTAPVVARAIGPDGRGITTAALAAFLIVPIVLAIGIPIELRRSCVSRDGDPLVRAARLYWLLAFVPSVLLAVILMPLIFSDVDRADEIAIFVGVASAPVTMSWMGDVSVLVARGRYRQVMAIRLLQPTLVLVGVVVAIPFDAVSVRLVIAMNILASIAAAVVGARSVGISIRGDRAPLDGVIRKGLHFSGGSVAEAASNRLDQMLSLPIIGSYEAGIYSVAVTIGSLPLGLAHALGAGFFRDISLTPIGARATAIAQVIRSTSATAIVACVALAVIAVPSVPVLFGDEFSASVVPTEIAILGGFFGVVAYVGSMILVAENKGAHLTAAQILGLSIGILGLLLLGPPFGALGAAMASTIGYAVLLTAVMIALRQSPSALLPTVSSFRAGIRRLFVQDGEI